jgi:hypothetical protein
VVQPEPQDTRLCITEAVTAYLSPPVIALQWAKPRPAQRLSP